MPRPFPGFREEWRREAFVGDDEGTAFNFGYCANASVDVVAQITWIVSLDDKLMLPARSSVA